MRLLSYFKKRSLRELCKVGCAERAVLSLNDQGCMVMLTDPNEIKGSIGVGESKALDKSFAEALSQRSPVIFIIDSAGARITDGLKGLSAFTRMFRSALDYRIAGLPLISVVEGNCFGGASVMAALSGVLAVSDASRIALSGPRILKNADIPNVSVRDTATDSISLIISARERHRNELCSIFEASANRVELLENLLVTYPLKAQSIEGWQESLRLRLVRHFGKFKALDITNSSLTFGSGGPVGSIECFQLAEWLSKQLEDGEINIDVDCDGQKVSLEEEQLFLSEYIAYLAVILRQKVKEGLYVKVTITGSISGAIYVALAAAANRIVARPNARIRVLPDSSTRKVLNSQQQVESLEVAKEFGIVDAIESA